MLAYCVRDHIKSYPNDEGIPEVDRVDDRQIGVLLRQRYEDRRIGVVLQTGQSSASLATRRGLAAGTIDDMIDFGARVLLVSHIRDTDEGWFAALVGGCQSDWRLVQAVFVDRLDLVQAGRQVGWDFREKSVDELRRCFKDQMQELLELV
jgi:hypothetical protein